MKLISEVCQQIRGVSRETNSLTVCKICLFTSLVDIFVIMNNGEARIQVNGVGILAVDVHHEGDTDSVYKLLTERNPGSIQCVEVNILELFVALFQ